MVVHVVLKTISPAGDVSLGTIFQDLEFLRLQFSPEQPQILLSDKSPFYSFCRKIFVLETGKGFSMYSNELRQSINRSLFTQQVFGMKEIFAGGQISDPQKAKIHITISVYLTLSQVHNYLPDPVSF